MEILADVSSGMSVSAQSFGSIAASFVMRTRRESSPQGSIQSVSAPERPIRRLPSMLNFMYAPPLSLAVPVFLK
ncbi:hypothetical protein D3C72_2327090 [compost metagenome]